MKEYSRWDAFEGITGFGLLIAGLLVAPDGDWVVAVCFGGGLWVRSMFRYHAAHAEAGQAAPSTERVQWDVDPDSDEFLSSYEWTTVRYKVLRDRGRICECCGATPDDGVKMNVDHIRPRKHFPEFALDEKNLQVLCEVCNQGKGNWDRTDWRRDITD